VKRVVVVLALAAVLVAGLIASPGWAQEPLRGVYPVDFDVLACSSYDDSHLIHITGEVRYVGAGNMTPQGEILKWHTSGQGTAVDYQDPPNEYRWVATTNEYIITPSQQDYPFGSYTSQTYFRLVSPGQGGEDYSVLTTYHFSPNGVENVTFRMSPECPNASASATASATAQ